PRRRGPTTPPPSRGVYGRRRRRSPLIPFAGSTRNAADGMPHPEGPPAILLFPSLPSRLPAYHLPRSASARPGSNVTLRRRARRKAGELPARQLATSVSHGARAQVLCAPYVGTAERFGSRRSSAGARSRHRKRGGAALGRGGKGGSVATGGGRDGKAEAARTELLRALPAPKDPPGRLAGTAGPAGARHAVPAGEGGSRAAHPRARPPRLRIAEGGRWWSGAAVRGRLVTDWRLVTGRPVTLSTGHFAHSTCDVR
ncbi:hypothetical protein BDY21DRAFT_391169, partial [Lineolata rhizophorae]